MEEAYKYNKFIRHAVYESQDCPVYSAVVKARLNAGHFVSSFPDLPSRDPRLAKQLA
jgi:hypothetical protein